jgi:3',5'-cyclic-AMP phosphodiesterase
VALELTTVADDGAVFFDGAEVARLTDLEPDTPYEHDGVAFRTLPRPGGERLASVVTVNDVHFGETMCGLIEGFGIGPVLSVPTGADPYPEVMNRGAIAEIEAVGPDVVVAKGDLTSNGTEEEYQAFLGFYRGGVRRPSGVGAGQPRRASGRFRVPGS